MRATSGNRRRAAAAGVVSGSVLVVILIFLAVNWLGSRHWSRGDWTHAGLYSLSSVTKNVVKSLKQPVDITVFMTPQSNLYPQVKELIERYRALNGRMINVEYLDPRRNLARAQALVQQYKVNQNTVVFVSSEKKKYVTDDQIADYNYSGQPGAAPAMKDFKGEGAFTSAIIAVTSSKSPKIYFTAGHGEKDLDDSSERGYSQIKDLLAKDNDTTAVWKSLGQSAVPSDADLVVVGGPTSAFLPPEAAALDTYLSHGGRVLFLLDPVIPAAGSPPPDLGLGKLLREWGVKLDDDIVVDPGNALPFIGADTVYANHFGAHPIVDALASLKTAVIFPLARSAEPVTATRAGFTATALVQTTADGWGETDLAHLQSVSKDASDVQPPVTLALAVSQSNTVQPAAPGPASPARLVWVGDSDFASNAELQNVANANLFLNMAHWLLGNKNLVGIAPKTPEQTTLTLSSGQMRRATLLSLLVIPGLAILCGILVWTRRRR